MIKTLKAYKNGGQPVAQKQTKSEKLNFLKSQNAKQAKKSSDNMQILHE